MGEGGEPSARKKGVLTVEIVKNMGGAIKKGGCLSGQKSAEINETAILSIDEDSFTNRVPNEAITHNFFPFTVLTIHEK